MATNAATLRWFIVDDIERTHDCHVARTLVTWLLIGSNGAKREYQTVDTPQQSDAARILKGRAPAPIKFYPPCSICPRLLHGIKGGG